ncbi:MULTISPECIES: antitoxin VbhA family protein [Arsenicicoccus]|uniref:antitoxin VbhA family protein n=1 Tax=Arsenicicoccus TaxID=267408 RepID=UPI0012EC864D|nr:MULTISPECIES: antitoxin VbhA family protein [Arsenicicoccus]
MTLDKPITEQEYVARVADARRIRHSTEMEGGRTSDVARAEQDRYVRGEITGDELIALIKARHRDGR